MHDMYLFPIPPARAAFKYTNYCTCKRNIDCSVLSVLNFAKIFPMPQGTGQHLIGDKEDFENVSIAARFWWFPFQFCYSYIFDDQNFAWVTLDFCNFLRATLEISHKTNKKIFQAFNEPVSSSMQ